VDFNHLRSAHHTQREIGILLPTNQRQHRTLHIQTDVLPYALPNTRIYTRQFRENRHLSAAGLYRTPSMSTDE